MDFWKIFHILVLTTLVTSQEINAPTNSTPSPETSTQVTSVTSENIATKDPVKTNSVNITSSPATSKLPLEDALEKGSTSPAEDAFEDESSDVVGPVQNNTTEDPLKHLLEVEKPSTCGNRTKLAKQPVFTEGAVLKKCCPLGEAIFYGDNRRKEYCDTSEKPFLPILLDVVLYDDCIENDADKKFELDIEAGNPCNVSLVYSKENGDVLLIIQNGSLLVMDEYGKSSYSVLDDYCIDVDYATGNIFAIVCISPVDPHIGRGQTILLAIFMMISMPCLISVSVFHFGIRRLRTTHGLCLGSLSACLAVGFLLHAIVHLSEATKSKVGYAIQFFMLSYFFWLLMMCCNVVIVVWYYLPRYIQLKPRTRYILFAIYSIFALATALCIVLLTRSKGLSGMPSYFYQAWSESIQSSQRYFIPPVTTVLILCFMLLIVAYFGFRKLDSIVETRSYVWYHAVNKTGKDDVTIPRIDRCLLKETKQDAMCIAFLAIIIFTSWILEVVTFYSPGAEDYLAMMEVVNGLQGVFILMIFVVIRNRREIIVRWWHDRGSLSIVEVEMQDMKH